MPAENRLIRETSPYLLQHAHNPVDWYPWGPEAFDRARSEDRPILLSIGYSACHWCHVMERECFESPEIAGLMNRLFVNVKVDREERPDIDDVYMKAVQLLIGRGGWPLTVFVTPDGKPFYGGTYFPPVDRHGLPAFPRLLTAVFNAYRERRDEVERTVDRLLDGIARSDRGPEAPAAAIDPRLPQNAAEGVLQHVDWHAGGLGNAPKFPHAPAFQLLLRQHRATARPEFLQAVTVTCDRMADGGMHDQIGGGFHRYSVDASWLVPHFEKMLYDNAALPRLYLDAWLVTGEPRYREVVERTLDYLVRELRHEEGAFHSATDADSEGQEGKFFVWTPAQVRAVLSERDAELVCRYWGITEGGNFEGASIPHVASTVTEVSSLLRLRPEDVSSALTRARAVLYQRRAERIPPALDDKILTGWNGLAIGALAEAGRVFSEARFVEAARSAAGFVWHALRRDGRLLHGWAKGAAKHNAFLDDHVFFAAALLDLYEATGDPETLRRGRTVVDEMDERFHDAAAGGYFFTAHDAEPLVARPKPAADGAVPSGNGAAAHLLLRLHGLTGVDRYRERAEELLRSYYAPARESPLAYVSYLEALERWTTGATEVVVVGRRDAPDTRALWESVAGVYLPHRLLVHADPDADAVLPAPARDRPAIGGCATAYVCRGFVCSAPVTEPDALRALLET